MMLGMPPDSARRRDAIADTRMTIGEHLDELRRCLVRSLLALVLACAVCIWPAKYLLALIARPYVLALHRHDQTTNFLQTSPVEVILIYIKVVIFSGLVISGPYIIYQIWNFIAVGLYQREKQWIHKLVPISVGLFLAGVVFMYLFALLLALNFLVGFSSWLPLPEAEPMALERVLLGERAPQLPSSQPADAEPPKVPVFGQDPEEPPPGTVWFNLRDRKLKVRGEEQTYSVPLVRDKHRAMVTTHFKIGEYLSFVLVLTLAFGLAFQMPLVVVFLVRSGIVRIETLRKYRKVVILIIVVIAGMLAPPDLLSHLLLSGPMILLFELGLLFAARKRRPAR
jgi:Sec-independent protein secretion pathway component TatC